MPGWLKTFLVGGFAVLVGAGLAVLIPATATAEEALLWRLDAGYSQSRFSRADRKDWHEEYVALARKLDRHTSVNGRVDFSRRYSSHDTSVGAGVSHRFSDDFGGTLSGYVTPDADFLARWAVQADMDLKAVKGAGWRGPTIATLMVRHKDYDSGDSDNIDLGVVQYLSGGHWLTARWINTFERGPGKRLGGYLLRGDWQTAGKLRAFAGYSFAPETSDGVVVDVRSRFLGAVYSLNDTTSLNIDYAGEDRKGSYLRNTVTIGVTRRF